MWWKKKDDESKKRAHPRLVARNLVKITRKDGTKIARPSNIYDLSEGGLRIVCYENFPIGTPLGIELNLPDDGVTLELAANIVWIRPMKDAPGAWFAGVQFAHMDEDARGKLRAAVARHLGPQDPK